MNPVQGFRAYGFILRCCSSCLFIKLATLKSSGFQLPRILPKTSDILNREFLNLEEGSYPGAECPEAPNRVRKNGFCMLRTFGVVESSLAAVAVKTRP